jgi:metal-responsive CopG/Arc/MetJ family transcriptional regulator
MKSIQVMFDEPLLERLDADEEVKRDGRSAVLRRAAAAYLKATRRRATADAYRRAYGSGAGGSADLDGWADEGVWPET